jgi:hypothetical protein
LTENKQKQKSGKEGKRRNEEYTEFQKTDPRQGLLLPKVECGPMAQAGRIKSFLVQAETLFLPQILLFFN